MPELWQFEVTQYIGPVHNGRTLTQLISTLSQPALGLFSRGAALFLYLLKFFFLGGGYLRSWCLGTTWECSEGDGVRNFEYISPANAFDCARLSWPLCPVGKWLPGTALPGWDQILEWSLGLLGLKKVTLTERQTCFLNVNLLLSGLGVWAG